jgi:hypothetical protein
MIKARRGKTIRKRKKYIAAALRGSFARDVSEEICEKIGISDASSDESSRVMHRKQNEKDLAIDAAIDALTPAEWQRLYSRVESRLGPSQQGLIRGGRDPRSMPGVRAAVYAMIKLQRDENG